MIGQPVGEWVQVTSSKRSSPTPLLANRQHSAAWSSRRTLTQNVRDGAIASQVSLLIIGRKPARGGSRETDVNEPMVKPAGTSSAQPVTMVTPVGKWPRTLRNWAESNGVRDCSVIGDQGRQPRDTS